MTRILIAALLLALASPALAESGFPEGLQGHCWGCMHGCTPEHDAKICGWYTDNSFSRAQPSPPAINLEKCMATGQPEDCGGWVCGSYGCVKPSR